MNLTLWALQALPKRTLTAVVAFAARRPVSRLAIPWYVRRFGIDVTEAELPVGSYATLGAFFSRGLKPGARRVEDRGVVAPVDGTVSALGTVDEGRLIQAKGSEYTVAALLGSEELGRTFMGGEFITLYLSPRDYHRIHMPAPGRITAWEYIPGSLYPVNRSGVQYISGLYTRNERLVTYANLACGEMAMVKIGATIVGSVRTSYGPKYMGPTSRWKRGRMRGDSDIPLSRGSELGHFEFGSTVILLFQPGMLKKWLVTPGNFVRMGEQIAEFSLDSCE